MSNDVALLLSLTPHGDNAAILTVFSHENGLKRGLIRGLKKQRSFLQAGNIITLNHTRRLENQLGTFTAEPHTDYTTPILNSAISLNAISYLTELLARTLPEEQSTPHLFTVTDAFLTDLKDRTTNGLWQRLAFYELTFLTTMGYGLSLTEKLGAVPCPHKTPLMYVSPKTGRAVSQVMGKPYADKLFPLPHIFGGPEIATTTDLTNTFLLTGHFLNQLLFGKTLTSRQTLITALTQLEENDHQPSKTMEYAR